MVLRADGQCAGILKYMTDYTSRATYETGYIDRHIRNAPHYAEIARRFDGKRAVGLCIVEDTHTFEDAVFGEDATRESYHDYGGYQPLISQWFAVDNSLPTVYGGEKGACLVFGENARHIGEDILARGVIIDAHAAKILTERGVDVGMRACRPAPMMAVEYFCREDDYTIGTPNKQAVYYDITPDARAEVLSEFLKLDTGFGSYMEHLWKTAERCPACYYYENARGQRFLVYTFVAERSWAKGVWHKGLFRNYYRQAQLCDGIARLQGKRLPAMCRKNPELYILCKEDEDSLAVGLWNFFADSVLDPVVELDGVYQRADFYHCSGELHGDTVRLREEIAPYSFAFFTVYR